MQVALPYLFVFIRLQAATHVVFSSFYAAYNQRWLALILCCLQSRVVYNKISIIPFFSKNSKMPSIETIFKLETFLY